MCQLRSAKWDASHIGEDETAGFPCWYGLLCYPLLGKFVRRGFFLVSTHGYLRAALPQQIHNLGFEIDMENALGFNPAACLNRWVRQALDVGSHGDAGWTLFVDSCLWSNGVINRYQHHWAGLFLLIVVYSAIPQMNLLDKLINRARPSSATSSILAWKLPGSFGPCHPYVELILIFNPPVHGIL